MKQISTNAVITGIRGKVDGSLGLSISTPELTVSEKTAFLELQGVNVTIGIIPMENDTQEKIEVDKEVGEKTSSQRLRNVLFILWKQEYQGQYPAFRVFYEKTMETVIDKYKAKLD